MSQREVRWRSKPTAELLENMARVLGDPTEGVPGITMFLVGNPAPTSYLVREDGVDETFRVMVGSRQQCSCGGGLGGAVAAVDVGVGSGSVSCFREKKLIKKT